MRRVVRLYDKELERMDSYPTLSDLVRRNGADKLGISIGALYNAMSTNKGKWENERFRIYYEDIDISAW